MIAKEDLQTTFTKVVSPPADPFSAPKTTKHAKNMWRILYYRQAYFESKDEIEKLKKSHEMELENERDFFNKEYRRDQDKHLKRMFKEREAHEKLYALKHQYE